MIADRYVAGVDYGGAKTIALVADTQGRILGASRFNSSGSGRAGLEGTMAAVAAEVGKALAQAGLSGDQVEMAVFGLNGADWPEDHEPRAALLQAAGIARRVLVKNDAFVGLRAGTRQPYGLVIGAGSGTNTAVITPDGREWAFGYYATGGGGSDIAREAIHAALRQDDGRGPRTTLTAKVLAKLDHPTVEAMLRALVAGKIERHAIRSLCPLVFEAAYEGDEVACDIVTRQGSILAEYAVALIRRFDMQGLEFDVVLAGSVYKGKGPLLVDTITLAVHRVAPRVRIVRPAFEPAVGGLLLAYDALAITVAEEMYTNLAHTAPEAAFFDTSGGQPPEHPLSPSISTSLVRRGR